MLGCGFSSKTNAKNVREKATKCPLNTSGILLNADRHVLPKFDIHRGAVAHKRVLMS